MKLEDDTSIYHAGDTGVFGSMKLFREFYRVDVALLLIGGGFTMDAVQASKALMLLKPKIAIPMHYRTFPFLEQDANRSVRFAKKGSPKVKIVVLEPGQGFIFRR